MRLLLLFFVGMWVALVSAADASPEAVSTGNPQSSEIVAPQAEQDSDYILEFRDRKIDLEPHIRGFPYARIRVDFKNELLSYLKTGPDGHWLYLQDLPETGEVDFTGGQRISDIDWSRRILAGTIYHPPTHSFLIRADEANEERFNLFRLDIETRRLARLTDHDYTYGSGLSHDHERLIYIARHGKTEPFNSCLHVVELDSDSDNALFCDEGGEDRFTWTNVVFSPDSSHVIIMVQHDGDRSTRNLARIDLDKDNPSWTFLLDRGLRHMNLRLLGRSHDDEQLLFLSAKSGSDNLYRYIFSDGTFEQLTDFSHDISSARAMRLDNRGVAAVTLREGPDSRIVLVDTVTGDLLFEERTDLNTRIGRAHEDVGIVLSSSVDFPFQMERFRLERQESGQLDIERNRFAGVSDALAEQLIHCDTYRLTYPTFDTLEDGSRRMIHAYYYTPRVQPKEDQQLVITTTFYGGGNAFNRDMQIRCAAGISTFSPAPRGSWGHGTEFAALNDGDLGGDDVVDIIHAAQWLEHEKGYRPDQIGLFGGSHGGYLVMRALTFPEYTNDRNASYDFGFGISYAGISDLLHFHRTSNIPDWLVQLAGDPETQADKLRERSPLNHVHRLHAPLLLMHGANDSRVPPAESRRFYEHARQLDKPVRYIELEGWGHGFRHADHILKFHRVQFEFLEDYLDESI
jgi:dipeptidyl aminopeptidase/acylaminoacyl peptidase